MDRPKWMANANCAGTSADLFFTPLIEDGGTKNYSAKLYAEARKVCSGCTVKAECLEWGMSDIYYGMYGGLSPLERRNLRQPGRSASGLAS